VQHAVGYHPRRNEVVRHHRARQHGREPVVDLRPRTRPVPGHPPPDACFSPRGAKAIDRPTTWHQAIPAIADSLRSIVERHGASAVGVVASGELTNEECFLARSIFRDGLGIPTWTWWSGRSRPSSTPSSRSKGTRIRTRRGPASSGLRPGPKGLGVKDMIRAAAEGSIRAMVFLRGGPLELFGEAQAVARALGRLECLIVIDILPSPVSERAHWVLPGVSFAEREGTYTNSQGRVQRAPKVFSLRGDTREDWRIPGRPRPRARRVDARRFGSGADLPASRAREPRFRGARLQGHRRSGCAARRRLGGCRRGVIAGSAGISSSRFRRPTFTSTSTDPSVPARCSSWRRSRGSGSRSRPRPISRASSTS
jgi:hypothetical protein